MTTTINIDALRSVLGSTQRVRKIKNGLTIFLVSDDSDWLVIMQCLQDHGLFKYPKKRPPLAAFEKWVRETGMPQTLTICNVYDMSMASRELHGARYPWKDVTCHPEMLRRWRALYQILEKRLSETGIPVTRKCEKVTRNRSCYPKSHTKQNGIFCE